MLNFLLKKATLMQSVEDADTVYLCVGNKRFIFKNNKYVGWYRP
jgi:hypothetical protein